MKTLAIALAFLCGLASLAEAKTPEKTLCVFTENGTRCTYYGGAEIRGTRQAQATPGRHKQDRARVKIANVEPVAAPEQTETFRGFDSHVVSVARGYVGTNPGGWKHPTLWCMEFVNKVLGATGHRVVNSARAIDALHAGTRVSSPSSGDLVVYRHHVGFFVRWQGRLPVLVQGNFNGIVDEYVHRGRPVAFIRPS